jgi:hypothetical protein
MTTSATKPVSFGAWFRNNPGHVARALPASFTVFSIVLVASFLIQGTNIGDTFVTASLLASAAGGVRTLLGYLWTVAVAVRPEADTTGAGGITYFEIMASIVIIAVIALVAIPMINHLVNR